MHSGANSTGTAIENRNGVNPVYRDVLSRGPPNNSADPKPSSARQGEDASASTKADKGDNVQALKSRLGEQEIVIQALMQELNDEREHNRLLAESIPLLQSSIQKKVDVLVADNTALRAEVEALQVVRKQLEKENLETHKALDSVKAQSKSADDNLQDAAANDTLRNKLKQLQVLLEAEQKLTSQLQQQVQAQALQIQRLTEEREQWRNESGTAQAQQASTSSAMDAKDWKAEVARLKEERAHMEEEMTAMRQALDDVTAQISKVQKEAERMSKEKSAEKNPALEASVASLKKELLSRAREEEKLRGNFMQERDRRMVTEQKALKMERDLQRAITLAQENADRADNLQQQLEQLLQKFKLQEAAAATGPSSCSEAEVKPSKHEEEASSTEPSKEQQETNADQNSVPSAKEAATTVDTSPKEDAATSPPNPQDTPPSDEEPSDSDEDAWMATTTLVFDPTEIVAGQVSGQCASCGTAMDADLRFCPQCGRPAKKVKPLTPERTPSGTPPNALVGNLATESSITPVLPATAERNSPMEQSPPTSVACDAASSNASEAQAQLPSEETVPSKETAPSQETVLAKETATPKETAPVPETKGPDASRGRKVEKAVDQPPLRSLTPRRIKFRPSFAICTPPQTQRSRSLDPAQRPGPPHASGRPGSASDSTGVARSEDAAPPTVSWRDRDPDVARLVLHLQAARPRPFGLPQANAILALVRPVMERITQQTGGQKEVANGAMAHYHALEEDICFGVDYCDQRTALPFQLWHNLLVSLEALCKYLVPNAEVYDYLIQGVSA